MTSQARLVKDFKDIILRLKQDNDDDVYFYSDPDSPIEEISNMTQFSLLLRGPPDTPYSGGLFRIKFEIPCEYPFKPPKIKFQTNIHHPNIRGDNICLDILTKSWSPALNIYKVILSLSALLSDPNGNDPLNADAGLEFRTDIQTFKTKAIEMTKKYAIKDENREYLIIKNEK